MNARQLLRVAIIAALVSAAWIALVHLATAQPGMDAMHGIGLTAISPWSVAHVEATFTMWEVMMAAMMLPAAARAIATHGLSFAGGYAIVWTGVSGAATALQVGLEYSKALSPALAFRSAPFALVVIAIAIAYQLSPMKAACLRGCRSELGLPTAGASLWTWTFRAGLRYGVLCVGCCSGLMLMMFVGGLMDLAWVVAIALVVLIERLLTPAPISVSTSLKSRSG